MRACSECGNSIPPERLEFVPDAKLCVTCLHNNGDVATYAGVPCYSHKTGASLGIIGPRASAETRRLISNQYTRVRYRGSGFSS